MKRIADQLDSSLIWMLAGILIFIGGMFLAAATMNYFAFFLFLVIGGLVALVGARKRTEWEKARKAKTAAAESLRPGTQDR